MRASPSESRRGAEGRPRVTIAGLGRAIAWIALAAALARPRVPGERPTLAHLGYAALGCLMVWSILDLARIVRRAESAPGGRVRRPT